MKLKNGRDDNVHLGTSQGNTDEKCEEDSEATNATIEEASPKNIASGPSVLPESNVNSQDSKAVPSDFSHRSLSQGNLDEERGGIKVGRR